MKKSFLFLAFLFTYNSYAQDFAIISDAGRWNANTKKISESILKTKTTRLVMAGDNLYSLLQGYEKTWNPWKEKGFTFDVVAIGNHNAGYQKEIQFFQMPGEFFRKDSGDTSFFVLNSDNRKYPEKQIEWLKKELTDTKAKFVFVVYHHPTYTLSSEHEWIEKKAFQAAIRPVLKEFRSKITALIVGHDHIAELATFDDLPVILSGAGQEIRRDKPVDNVQQGVKVKSLWYFDHKPYWAQLSINSKAVVHFIRAEDQKTACSITLETGKAPLLEKNCGETKKSL